MLAGVHNLTKNRHSDSLKKSQLTLSQGVDEERRCHRQCWWWWGENQCITELGVSNTMYWEIVPWDLVYIALPSYRKRNVGRGWQDIDGQLDTYPWSWLSFCSQANLHTPEQGFQNLHEFFTIIFWLGKKYKAVFFIYGDTLLHYRHHRQTHCRNMLRLIEATRASSRTFYLPRCEEFRRMATICRLQPQV